MVISCHIWWCKSGTVRTWFYYYTYGLILLHIWSAPELFWKSWYDWSSFNTANDCMTFKIKGFRLQWLKRKIKPKTNRLLHLEFSAFFALSKQIPIVYSADRGRAEKNSQHRYLCNNIYSTITWWRPPTYQWLPHSVAYKVLHTKWHHSVNRWPIHRKSKYRFFQKYRSNWTDLVIVINFVKYKLY